MTLSIIIVSYNVKNLLNQCLHSVYSAINNIDAEIFVVDNNSVDNSSGMLKSEFSEVKLIENNENLGFAKACNQALRKAKGEYVLLLNPDTLVDSESLTKCIKFMGEHPEGAALGVKMINNEGKFLPESKRGIPSPMVSFYKISGLSKLFPKSKVFGQYHLSFLDNDKVAEVPILSGAFMFIRMKALKKVGLLDESFFMYGEDIDLSLRLVNAGYKNFYYPETSIIHYKGESTKKSSINYIRIFYNAMIIFAKKHYQQKGKNLFILFIYFAIYMRAGLSLVKQFLLNALLPILDFSANYLILLTLIHKWGFYKFHDVNYYPPEYKYYFIPAYILVWMTFAFLNGAYRKNIKLKKLVKGIFLGTIVILAIYSVLPENYRFSRAILLFGALIVNVIFPLNRIFLSYLNLFSIDMFIKKTLQYAVVGDITTDDLETIKKSYKKHIYKGTISYKEKNNYLGNVKNIVDLVKINTIDCLIFSNSLNKLDKTIGLMMQLADKQILFKFLVGDLDKIDSITFSSAYNGLDELDTHFINQIENKILKRSLDFGLSFVILLISPVILFLFHNKKQFLHNITNVFISKYTFVSYITIDSIDNSKLPKLKKGVFDTKDILYQNKYEYQDFKKLNYFYAKNYYPLNDIKIILKNIRNLDRKPDNS